MIDAGKPGNPGGEAAVLRHTFPTSKYANGGICSTPTIGKFDANFKTWSSTNHFPTVLGESLELGNGRGTNLGRISGEIFTKALLEPSWHVAL